MSVAAQSQSTGHGLKAYALGCRCGICKTAKANADLRAARGGPTHGYSTYSRGCRCQVCRAAKATRTRERRAKARERARASGWVVKDIKHGLSGYQNHCCRCVVCCEAKTADNRSPATVARQRAAYLRKRGRPG